MSFKRIYFFSTAFVFLTEPIHDLIVVNIKLGRRIRITFDRIRITFDRIRITFDWIRI